MPPSWGYMTEDDLRGQKFYDARLTKRLIGFSKPYIWIMVIAFVFLMIASLFQLYLPYLSREAIDKYIVSNFQLLFLPQDSIRTEFENRYGGVMFPVGSDSFVINGSFLSPSDAKLVLPGKFMPIFEEDLPKNIADSAKQVISEYKEYFLPVGNLPLVGKIPEHKKFSLGKIDSRKPQWVISHENLVKIPTDKLRILRSGHISGIYRITLIYLVLLMLSFALTFGEVYLLSLLAQKVIHDIRVKLFGHLLSLSLKFFDRNPVGRLVTRVTNDVDTIAEMFTSVAVNIFKDVLTLVGVAIVLIYMNWRLALLVFIVIPILTLLTIFFRKKMRDAYRWVRKTLASLNARLSEDLGGVRITQAFCQEEKRASLLDKDNEEYYKATMHQLWVIAIFQPLAALLRYSAMAIVIWYGGGMAIQQQMTLGMLVAYMSYIGMFFQPIAALTDKYSIMQSAMAASERIFGLMDTQPDIENPEKPYKPKPDKIRGKIEFRNVWFAYNEDEEEYVLRDVSFVAQPGERIAFVGATGAGKTTIISLLSRLYDIKKGQILVDDVDIRQWDIPTLRQSVGIVLQDVFLFSTNILENIRLNEKTIDIDRVRRSAKVVNANQFIENLPLQYNEPVAERGITLSVGQRQLLSFARALVFDPKILVLDEATANIDSQTEKLIQDAIEKLLTGRTSIVIAHRLSTIRKADKILVMHKGKIVESGTHKQLLEKGGYYSKLYKMQLIGINNNNDNTIHSSLNKNI